MIVAKLKRKLAAADGKPFLAGALSHDVRRGTLVILKKDPDAHDCYQLIELGSRRINSDPQTVFTWTGSAEDTVTR